MPSTWLAALALLMLPAAAGAQSLGQRVDALATGPSG